MFRKTGTSQGHLAHSIEGIRNNYQNGIGRTTDDLINHFRDDVGICLQQVVATHPRLSWKSGCDNDNVGVFRTFVSIRADHSDVETFYWSGFSKIESLSLGNTFYDVNQNYVA